MPQASKVFITGMYYDRFDPEGIAGSLYGVVYKPGIPSESVNFDLCAISDNRSSEKNRLTIKNHHPLRITKNVLILSG